MGEVKEIIGDKYGILFKKSSYRWLNQIRQRYKGASDINLWVKVSWRKIQYNSIH
ncbi:hypothetical protein EV204_11730 [Tissierella praeacuta]|uniref:hypothetical protein n=1 Tax=Tissierella praeacuta TaxID=43131 RepID=UPI0010DAF9D1|nr:hypothetical protein [Tissierella praeacuta]TCU65638.1 hypothetical protein EV204_11730 [Tissierella praeacuta]